jgi:hypothetical protein
MSLSGSFSMRRALGFREVGRRDFDGSRYSATLFEKTLRNSG